LTTEEKIKNERKYSYFYEHEDLEEDDLENLAAKRNSVAQSERGTGTWSSFKKFNIDEILERKVSLLQNLKKLSQTKERSASNVKADSYYDAIKTLSYLSLVQSPFEKMKVLLLIIRKLIKTINEFYIGK